MTEVTKEFIQKNEDEKIIEIEIERLRSFKNHPFQVKDDNEMHLLKESIEKYGILTPLIVRPVPDAPDGFVTSNEEKEFTFEYGKPEEAEVSYEFVFENEPTKVELTKTDLTTGKELPGAHLKVTDEDGNVIDEWVSTEKAHVIKGLTVGKSYMMTETKPADGYVTAESITFRNFRKRC